MRRVLICLLTALSLLTAVSLGACGSDGGDPIVAPPPQAPPASIPVWTMPSIPASMAPAATTSISRLAASTGWEITVYYTAVQKYHHGAPVEVTGCPALNCTNGHDDLGSYPKDFVQAVKDEGTGRTTDGRYLNWSYDTGYWLDTATRDSYGNPLEAFVSAAADPDVLDRGTRFTIVSCGKADDGSAPPATVCAALKSAHWVVTDEFTPGLGGSKHLDAYVGPETGPGFTDSDWYLTLEGATIT